MIVLRDNWDYYNDFDPGAVAWLNELIKQKVIPDGEVDGRSILNVNADELSKFRRVHLFAGIGGWAEAARIAGLPDDMRFWSGSAPCQPFSAAGRQEGRNDERHLAPHFINLVGAGRPPVLFGEQVASAEVLGKAAGSARKRAGAEPAWAWIDDLCDRLEAARYAVGASDYPSAGVGAPHIRQRTFFGAVANEWLGVSDVARRQGRNVDENVSAGSTEQASAPGKLADAHGRGSIAGRWFHDTEHHAEPCGGHGGLADAVDRSRQSSQSWATVGRSTPEAGGDVPAAEARPLHGFWSDADWLFCRDGKWRPVEPGTFPLAYGVSGRVGLLRGYGNAINPHAGAVFIKAFLESIETLTLREPAANPFRDLLG